MRRKIKNFCKEFENSEDRFFVKIHKTFSLKILNFSAQCERAHLRRSNSNFQWNFRIFSLLLSGEWIIAQKQRTLFNFSGIEIFVGAISKRNRWWILNGDGRNATRRSGDEWWGIQTMSTVNSAANSMSSTSAIGYDGGRRVRTMWGIGIGGIAAIF